MRRAVAALAAAAFALAACALPASAQQAPKYLDKQYSDAVHELRDCLGVLSPTSRKIVVLRSGIGPRDPASPRQVAAAVNISVARVGTAQWAPIRQMRAAQKAGKCGTAKAAAPNAASTTTVSTTTTTATPTPATPSAPAAAAAPAKSGGWNSPAVLILLGVAGLCLLGVLRELVGAVRA